MTVKDWIDIYEQKINRKKWNKTPGINLLKTKFKKIYDLKVDGNIINSVYKGEN